LFLFSSFGFKGFVPFFLHFAITTFWNGTGSPLEGWLRKDGFLRGSLRHFFLFSLQTPTVYRTNFPSFDTAQKIFFPRQILASPLPVGGLRKSPIPSQDSALPLSHGIFVDIVVSDARVRPLIFLKSLQCSCSTTISVPGEILSLKYG